VPDRPFLPPRAVVLLPTYNEIDNLGRIVPAILEAATVDILILDDNSPDGTGALADHLAQAHDRVHVVHRAGKEGLGAAYLAGFRHALDRGYTSILQMDADFSHPPTHLGEMLRLSKMYDVVLGSRWVPGGGTQNWPVSRQIISKMGSFYARTVLGLSVKDLTGGFKCFRREVLEQIDFAHIHSTGYAFQIEMTYRAIRLGFRVHETPILFVERAQGVSKMSHSIVGEAILGVPKMRLQRVK
jgi:dolichol-phosphate mannosyltransferase